MLKIFKNYLFLFIFLTLVVLFTGCSGENSVVPETYDVIVEITTLDTGLGEVVLKNDDGDNLGQTNSEGLANLIDLSGNVKIIPTKNNYTFEPEYITVSEATTISFEASSPSVAGVSTAGEFNTALSNETIENIIFTDDITGDINTDHLVILNFAGNTLNGNIIFNTDETGELMLKGPGIIDGNLTVDAKNASVNNELQVTGEINIEDVSSNSWDENYNSNNININDSNASIRINQGAANLIVNGSNNQINVNGTVTSFVANSVVVVSGAENIQNALINSPDVQLDSNPVSIDDDSIYQPGLPDSLEVTLTPEDVFPYHFCLNVTDSSTGDPVTGLDVGNFILMSNGNQIPLEMALEEFPEDYPGKYTVYPDQWVYSPILGFDVRLPEGEYTIIFNKSGYATVSLNFTHFIPTEVPYATDVSISGTLRVGKTLTGSYTFNANDNGDSEANTTFKWYRADSEFGLYSIIDGATGDIYTLVEDDQDKYIKFAVIVKDEQNNTGSEVKSEAAGPVAAKITAPYATDVSLSGEAVVGGTLTGSYVFNPSDDGDAEEGTIYQWFRADEEDGLYSFIQFETDQTYVVKAEDINKYIKFEVLVIDEAGKMGVNVRSNPVGPIVE